MVATPIFSHPPEDGDDGRRLANHLCTVRDNALAVGADDAGAAPGGTPIDTLVEIAALTHDLGKAHPDIQRYLTNDDIRDGPPHAPLGAAAAFHAARARGIPDVDATIACIAVARHHQGLPSNGNPYEYLYDTFKELHLTASDGESPISEAIDEIGSPDAVTEPYVEAADGEASWSDFEDASDGDLASAIDDAVTEGFGSIDMTVESEDYYAALLRVWSRLIFADKIDASDVNGDDATPPSTPPKTEDLRTRVNDLGGEQDDQREQELNKLRQDAFELVNGTGDGDGTVHEFAESDANLATLTLPTGLGKTYTGLTAALELRDRLVDDGGQVIYALPYTSIIDQTDEDIRGVFCLDPTDPEYTIHHHLSDTVTTFGEEESERFSRDERFLGECWQANIVLSTFVQLFESVLGPNNRKGLKLPNLSNSVIVLDEPQALPIGDWDYIRDAIHVLTTAYDATVILMTATQPRLFAPDDRFDPVELVDGGRDFAAGAERVTYTFHESTAEDGLPLPIPDAAELVVDDLEIASDDPDSALVIANTIDSSRVLMRDLTDLVDNHSDGDPLVLNEIYDDVLADADPGNAAERNPESVDEHHPDATAIVDRVTEKATADTPTVLLHLSSRHRPIDREVLIDAADALTQSADLPPVVFVATQIVEAGVDISFDRAYRDFAPLDSIVQAAGRCNRNFEHDTAPVTVWELASPGEVPVDSSAETPAEKVYASSGNNLLAVTRDAIAEVAGVPPVGDISDSTVSVDAVEAYYDLVKNRTAVEPSPVLSAATDELDGYSLIEEHCKRSIEVFVPRTTHEVRVFDRLREMYRRREYEKLIAWIDALSKRTVSVGVYEDDFTPIETRASQITPADDGIVDAYRLEYDSRGEVSFFDPIDGVTNEHDVEDFLL